MTNHTDPAALPGGAIGPETAGPINADRWIRPGTGEYRKDSTLEHTSIRWAGGHWYVVTTDHLPDTRTYGHPIRGAVRRSGPYETIADVERRLLAETERAANGTGNHEPTREQVETIDATIREGMVQRLYGAASRWVSASATQLESERNNRRAEPGEWERHSTFEFNQDDDNARELEQMHDEVVKAADAYRKWLAQLVSDASLTLAR